MNQTWPLSSGSAREERERRGTLRTRRCFLAATVAAPACLSLAAPASSASTATQVSRDAPIEVGIWSSSWDVDAIVRQCRAANARSVTLESAAIPGFAASAEGVGDSLRAMADTLGEAGIAVAAVFGNVGADAASVLDGAAQRAEVRRVSALLDAMQRAGVGVLINYVHTRLPAVPAHDAALWAGLERLFREIAPAAEQAGVRLANHGVWQCLPEALRVRALQEGIRPEHYRQFRDPALRGPWLVHTVDHIARLIEAAPNPANGLCFCTGMYATGAWPPDQAARFKGRIFFAQIRDIKGGTWPWAQEAFLGEGDLDFAAVFRSLRAAGFRGSAHPEHLGPPRIDEGVWDRRGERSHLNIAATGYIKGILDALDVPLDRPVPPRREAWPH